MTSIPQSPASPLDPASPSPSLPSRQWQELRQELRPEALVASVTGGIITALVGIIRAISYAALIFAGPLAVHLDVGIGMAILSSAIISFVVACTSSLPGMIATPLAAPTAVLSILTANIVAQLGDRVPAETLVATVIAAIAVGSLVTGLSLWLLGRFRLGRVVQFIPYPVIGGFMAGTGWLLIRGAFEVITEESLKFSTLTEVCQGSCQTQWFTGLGIGIALLLITKRFHHYLTLPVSLGIAIVLFYGVLHLQGIPLETARAQGWLLGTFGSGNLWHPLGWQDLTQVQWGAIASQGDTLGLLMFVSLLSLVLTNNGIELSIRRDLDLDRELQAIGLANFMAGLGSSMVGNQALPSTLLVYKMGAPYRLVGVFKALCCLGILGVGSQFLPFLPRPILGSLLVYLGLNLLLQWLYETYPHFSKADYLIIWVTMGVINYFGFLQGILVGFVAVLLGFLYRYSSLGVIQPGADFQGGVLPFHLQGFLFFGNANSLLNQVRQSIVPGSGTIAPTAPDPGATLSSASPSLETLACRYLLLDFQQVQGLDASAVLSFQRITQLAYQKNLEVVYTHVSPEMRAQLAQGQALQEGDRRCHVFSTFQEGLAWCQTQTPA